MISVVAKISILCPSFNHQRFIAEHIKSVLNQSFKDFELVIVDDCRYICQISISA